MNSGAYLYKLIYPQKSPLFVPLSVYDVTTALLFCVLIAFQLYFISDLGLRFRIWTVSFGYEGNTNMGIVVGGVLLGWLHYLG